MRILHVASSYPHHAGDVTAPFMEELLSSQAARGHDVGIVVPSVDGLVEGDRRGVDVVGARYAPVSSLEVWGHGRSLDARGRLRFSAAAITPIAMWAMARTTRRQIVRLRPEVLHLHWIWPQGALALFQPDDLPVVISLHGADAKFAHGRLASLTSRILRRADGVVAASGRILQSVVPQEHSSKAHSIPHGADKALFEGISRDKARDALDVDPEASIVLAIGRLVPKKGFGDLIQAIAALRHSSAKLIIIGDGPLRDNLDHKVAELAVADMVRLVGRQSREQVGHWIAAADLVVIPSKENSKDMDSGPVVLMEALAGGRAVVSTRIGMAPEIIEDGRNGYLVDSPDPDQLAQAIMRALENQTELESAARETFSAIGGWDRVTKDLDTVYADAIERRRAALSSAR